MADRASLPGWDGEDAYVIGGGPSLRGFDWSRLRGRNTIGCNQAFRLGNDVVKMCAFGDTFFYDCFCNDLEKYAGWVVTNCFFANMPDWIHWFKRIDEGLAKGDTLAWNNNTGAMAINLALVLGAKNVYLLGFDMGFDSAGNSHWHEERIQAPVPDLYDHKFPDGMATVAAALPGAFPGHSVFNAHNGTSRLTCFPSVSIHNALRRKP